jgi:hypothetical protein
MSLFVSVFLTHFVNRIAYKARVPCVLSLFGLICYERVLDQYRELESSSVARSGPVVLKHVATFGPNSPHARTKCARVFSRPFGEKLRRDKICRDNARRDHVGHDNVRVVIRC